MILPTGESGANSLTIDGFRFQTPRNQLGTRCRLFPLLSDSDTALVHSRCEETTLRCHHALSCRQEPGLFVRQMAGACTPSMLAPSNVPTGRSLPHHREDDARSIAAAVEIPCVDQFELIEGGKMREGRGTAELPKEVGRVRRVSIVRCVRCVGSV